MQISILQKTNQQFIRMKIFIALTVCLCSYLVSFGQTAFIRLVNPGRESNNVSQALQFIIGSTCKTCSVTVNDVELPVLSTGAFAYEINFTADTVAKYVVVAKAGNSKATKNVSFNYSKPAKPVPVTALQIESIETYPDGNLILQAGDRIDFKVKAQPGGKITTINNTTLYEMPLSQTNGMAGVYQGTYAITAADNFSNQKFTLTLTGKDGQQTSKQTSKTFSVMSPFASDMCITQGRLAHLEYGLGDDRLGGAKIGYLDSMIPLHITGKVDGDYKIALAPNHTAYINDDLVKLLPKGTLQANSLTGQWKVYGDENYDYVTVGLQTKLPYQSMQLLNPSAIAVDIYGATLNTNWITQLETIKEVQNVTYEQLQDEIVRVTIYLKHKQHWGHEIYYNGNLLVIKIKQQPKDLSLNKLTIAIDAGHGGSNTGAGGPTGSSEKLLTLQIAQKLQRQLEAAGAKVITTRQNDQFFDNKARILYYRDNRPDLLVSIHLNSAVDPFRAQGTSSLYKYPGFRPLSLAVHKRMLQLGLAEYGNIGSFNFMLNSPTEYPNVLIETLFLSNLKEEELILNVDYQTKMAIQITEGIKDFLRETAAQPTQ